ncbi:MAG: exodeoxyribonuclease I [Gammaproteobacteria bacterium]|nr:exodeoxyribonuclease I [Gammaproteobacteria bacterium]
MSQTFFWYDYETFGISPGSDRVSQFAGLRTDSELNLIADPILEYCQPADDFLPDPGACLITGISPQLCLQKGLPEYQFIEKIHQQFSTPETCIVGYNNIRFDDEFTRFLLYRNFYDPYAHEWQNGNSRWDLLDIARLTGALRPDGINWPKNDEGKNSFRLELLTQANGIEHENAHDALADVYATIAFAKLIKEKQPKLFDFCLSLRHKHKVSEIISVHAPKPFIHVTGMYPGEYGHCAIVYPLMQHPSNKNAILVYDCRYKPDELPGLSVEDIKYRLFTNRQQLETEQLERIAIKSIHINKCPAVAPLSTLNPAAQERNNINLSEQLQNAEKVASISTLSNKLTQCFTITEKVKSDADQALYTGGFFSPGDKEEMNKLRFQSPEKMVTENFKFTDPRLDDLFFRYKGRNFKDLLSSEDLEKWQQYRLDRILNPESPAKFTLEDYYQQLKTIKSEHSNNNSALISQLEAYPKLIGLEHG